MINDKEFLKFEEGFFKPYFEKFIEFKRGKGEKVASSTLIRFRKLNNSLNQYQTNQISEKMIRELLAPRNGLSKIERQRSEEHTSELQSRFDLVCRLLLEK